MEIRRATVGDSEQLVHLGSQAHAESPRYNGLEFDADRAASFLSKALANEWVVVLVAVDAGEIVGSFIGMLTPYFFSSALYGIDLFFYVRLSHRGKRAGLRLIREWERILQEDGRAAESTLGVTAGIEDDMVRKLYGRLGYTHGGYYVVKKYE